MAGECGGLLGVHLRVCQGLDVSPAPGVKVHGPGVDGLLE